MATLPRVRLTSRGWWLLVGGTGAALAGVLFATPVVARWGLVLLGAVAAGTAWLQVAGSALAHGGLRLERRVVPHPATVGERATVRVDVTARRSLAGLTVAETAAPQLTGPAPRRPRFSHGPGRITLSYPLAPVRRGRWPLGPLRVHRRDPFGVAEMTGPLGTVVQVAVRPRTVELTLPPGAFAADQDPSVSGTRAPAADDVALRPYRAGDDLRRVHWRSSARRGELVVRQDERSARRPAAVLLDLPLDAAAAEWSISLACSVAAVLARAGHHVRLLTGEADESLTHLSPDPDGTSIDAVLDRAIDLTVPPDARRRADRVARAVGHLADHPGPEIVVAVIGTLADESLARLADLGGRGAQALVRTGRPGDRTVTTAQARTVRTLARSGWGVAKVTPGEDLAECWRRVTAQYPAGVPR